MRILFFKENAAQPSSAANKAILPDLEAMGHRIIRADVQALAHVFGHGAAQRTALAYVRAYRPHVVLSNPPYDMLAVETCAAIRALGVPMLAWRYDDAMHWTGMSHRPRERHRLFVESCRKFTANATTSRTVADYLAELGVANARYIRLACSSQPLEGGGAVEPVPVSFIGNAYDMQADQGVTRRVDVVRHLQQEGLPVALWGSNWDKVPELRSSWRGYCPAPEFGATLRASAINLSINGWVGTMVKLRILEIALAGSFQLADHCDELDDYFDLGKELVTTTDQADLEAKVRFFLGHPDERQRIALAGRQRALRDHTWRSRWGEMVAALEDSWGQRVLDDDEPDFVDSEQTEPIVMASLALAHVSEAAGDRVSAFHYFDAAATLAPGDYGALAGKARISEAIGRAGASLNHWRHLIGQLATYGISWNSPPPPLGLKGIGSAYPRHPAADAVVQAARLTLASGDLEGFRTLIPRIAAVDPANRFDLANRLSADGHMAVSNELLAQVEAEWPAAWRSSSASGRH